MKQKFFDMQFEELAIWQVLMFYWFCHIF